MEAKFIEYFENFHKNQKNTSILCAKKYEEIIESIQSTNSENPNQTMEKNKLTPQQKTGMFATQFDMKMAAQFYTVTKRKLQRKKSCLPFCKQLTASLVIVDETRCGKKNVFSCTLFLLHDNVFSCTLFLLHAVKKVLF